MSHIMTWVVAKTRLIRLEKLLSYLYFIQRDSSNLVLTPQKVCFFMVLQAQGRLLLQELWQTELMLLLLESLGLSLYRDMLEREQEWLEKFSSWQDLRNLASFSLMKLMQLEEQDSAMGTVKFKGLCLKLSINLMVLIQEAT